jgi:dihydroorotate dehydrogenase
MSITLRGIKFRSVWAASGVQGFFGEGYWYHDALHMAFPHQFDFFGSTFTAKTTTLEARAGNMPLNKYSLKPEEWMPRCIYVNPVRQFALNAVGLSGPGAYELFRRGEWQQRNDEPFFLSFMSVQKTYLERMREFGNYLNILKHYLSTLKQPVGLQINVSCPNVGMKASERDLVEECQEMGAMVRALKIPVVIKTDPLISPEALCAIARSGYCDAITPSNTIGFAKIPYELKQELFPYCHRSPLNKFGGGGLSGNPALKYSLECVRNARKCHTAVPIIGGNGITHPDHIGMFKEAGAAGVSIGSVAFLRPHRLQAIIRRAHHVFN